MIIPFADMVNHETPHQLEYFIDEYTGGFRFTAAMDIAKNSPINISYGLESAESTFREYGFMPDMEHSLNSLGFAIPFILDADDQISEVKKAIFEKANHTGHYLYFDYTQMQHAFSMLRFAVFNENVKRLQHYAEEQKKKGIF
jgi:hypothetical protein